ncbi:MAG: HAD family phosphatase [Acidimicrobiales bacterium]|nr:HAD family phosphatase [Acidimicrobiales bacterium]
MTEWLLCDYGQVLSASPPHEEWERLRHLARSPADRCDDFDSLYWLNRPAYDRADLSALEYWTAVVGQPPAGSTLVQMIEIDTAIWLHPNRASVTAAVGAARRGFRLALFSNAPIDVAAGIDRLEWLGPFERRFYSCRLRSVKPEPEAYRKVLTALGAAPGDVTFFDDRPANVDAAAELGIRAVLFEGPEQLLAVSSRGDT